MGDLERGIKETGRQVCEKKAFQAERKAGPRRGGCGGFERQGLGAAVANKPWGWKRQGPHWGGSVGHCGKKSWGV